MAIRDIGNEPRASTAASLGADPSSGTLLAEVTNLRDVNYEVRYFVGASTNSLWRLQQCLSSGLGSTAVVDETVVLTASGQSAEFIINYPRIATTSYSTAARFRILASTGLTAQIATKVFVEPLT